MKQSPTYWLACSGGLDSVVLAHVLAQKKISFGLLHCNFQLREQDSDKDEVFVKELAQTLHIPIRIKTFKTFLYMKEKRINLELAARELRYDWFTQLIEKEDKIILLAHHIDDQIETFLMQLARGGKIKGLSGMPIYRNGYLRPLLNYTKKELRAIALKNGWNWREDKSNLNTKFKRNLYRHEIIPYLITNKFPIHKIPVLTKEFQILLHFFQKQIIQKTISKKEWTSWSIWYRTYVLQHFQLGAISEKEVTKLLEGERGKKIIHKNGQIWNEGVNLFITQNERNTKSYTLKTNYISKENMDLNNTDKLYVDAHKIEGEFTIRKWRKGDVFQPLGMKGQKSIAKFLRDKKIPSHQKHTIYVLTHPQAGIIGVFGFTIGENYKIDTTTNRVIAFELV